MSGVIRHGSPQFAALCDDAEKHEMRVELDVGADVQAGGFRTLGPIMVRRPKPSRSVVVNVAFDGSLELAAQMARDRLSRL